MKYALIGAGGMLGRAFRELFERSGRAYDALDVPAFDVTRREQVERAVTPGLTAVINCAAYTNVDLAEQEEAAATKLNGEAVALLAGVCAAERVPLVHFSTDYVFAGDAREPYRVDQAHAPLNAYGRSKAAGERALWQAGGPHLLLRTSWLYAPWGNNFVRTIYKLSRAQPSIKVVADQLGRPTSAEHLARVTTALLDLDAHGTLHVTDGGACSWHEFASEIVRLAGHPCRVDACTAAEFARPAKRPAYSVLDLAPTEQLVGPMPDWRDNLASVMARLEPA
ncbi:MAG TPA: dTDP-4-dehydrorhamnose reductase [Polyangiaceae bacterium]|nr:dTDP-4-dehydrorhamnose reductase [Polyangiaceae bacterium]